MTDLNSTTITGRLVRTPEIKTAPSGITVGSFSVAANHCYRTKGGDWNRETAFVPCVAFARVADVLVGRQKGDSVLVCGRLKTESWDSEGGVRSMLMLVAQSIHVLEAQPSKDVRIGQTEDLQMSEEVRKAVPF
jgi:single-strand DNA-binding protein